jgi:hypothetical protein
LKIQLRFIFVIERIYPKQSWMYCIQSTGFSKKNHENSIKNIFVQLKKISFIFANFFSKIKEHSDYDTKVSYRTTERSWRIYAKISFIFHRASRKVLANYWVIFALYLSKKLCKFAYYSGWTQVFDNLTSAQKNNLKNK